MKDSENAISYMPVTLDKLSTRSERKTLSVPNHFHDKMAETSNSRTPAKTFLSLITPFLELANFSMEYFILSKVYTDKGGINYSASEF